MMKHMVYEVLSILAFFLIKKCMKMNIFNYKVPLPR